MSLTALPPVWLGTRTDELTGGAINWGTTQNRRSKGVIPDACFARGGSRVLVIRDPFLDWWATTLSDARQPSAKPQRRDRRQVGIGPADAHSGATAAIPTRRFRNRAQTASAG
jgi:hypothetical protein